MQPASSLRGRVVSPGPLDPGGSATFARWVNDPALRPFLNRPWHISEEEERRRLATLLHAEDAVGFAIRPREDRSLIGRASIWNIHRVNRCGLFTIFIGEPARWSRGYGREARFHEGRSHDAIQMAILAREWSGGLREPFRGHLDPPGLQAPADPGS